MAKAPAEQPSVLGAKEDARLLAYIELDGRAINELMVERGYACVLHIPPNGESRIDEFQSLELAARMGMVGMWGACEEIACD